MIPNKHRIKGRIERKKIHLTEVPTEELVVELGKREAVTQLVIEPHEEYEIHRENGSTIDTGSAIILVVET